ncbi:F5/8 type C domain-containing protein [Brevibacillus sp. BC25]|nr:F5/8 type C domain-containing protein [Brevibacillus sp. BC25]
MYLLNSIYSTDYDAWKAFDKVNFSYANKYSYWSSEYKIKNGWLQVDFGLGNEKAIQKYVIANSNGIVERAPVTWTFEGSNNDTDWTILDSQTNVTNWDGTAKSFTFDNPSKYRYYRINIAINNGYKTEVDIGEFELMEKITSNPYPEPEPEPDPTPTGENALLVIKMISGLEKEFELTASEVQDFIAWYNDRADGQGKETYMFDKDFNKGPFTSRKDYVAFSKIQSFEVMEYTK